MGYLDSLYNITIGTNYAKCSSYRDAPVSGGTAFGITGAGDLTVRYALCSKRHQIRQNGGLLRVRMPINNLTNVSGIYLEFWKRNLSYTTGGPYPHTKQTETGNLLSQLTTNLAANVSFADITGVEVQEGDLIVIRLEASAVPCQPFLTQSGYSNATIRELRDNDAPATTYNWSAQTPAYTTTSIAVECYTIPPRFAMWGNSIFSGYYSGNNTRHASYAGYDTFTRSFDLENPSGSIAYKLAELLGVTAYQNLGVNSNRTSEIAGRMPDDLTDLLPDLLIIEGGTNDISASISEATFLANWTTILDAAKVQSNNVIVIGVMPRTDFDDTKAATRRAWNVSLESLVGTYTSNFHFVSLDEAIGVIRVSTGEYDNLNPIYAGDNIALHPNEAGNQVIADYLANYINQNNLI